MLFPLLLSLCVCAPAPVPADDTIRLIAHRGGIVDDQHEENMPASSEAAIAANYWMLEVDVQRSLDGEPIIHHDQTLGRTYGVRKRAAECTLAELRQLRSVAGKNPMQTFRELCDRCKGRVFVMVDAKTSDMPAASYEAIEQALRDNELLDSAFFIGDSDIKAYFKGKARVAVNFEELKKAIQAKEDVANLYFLFEHGNKLDAEQVALAKSVNVPVCASVNTLHYAGRRSTPEADIARLREQGIRLFQIDSAYDKLLK